MSDLLDLSQWDSHPLYDAPLRGARTVPVMHGTGQTTSADSSEFVVPENLERFFDRLRRQDAFTPMRDIFWRHRGRDHPAQPGFDGIRRARCAVCYERSRALGTQGG